MPHVTVHPGTERKPVYQVGGKSFVFFRNPRPDAFNPDTRQRYDDVIVFWVPDEGDKLAMVQDDSSPFFTTSMVTFPSCAGEPARRDQLCRGRPGGLAMPRVGPTSSGVARPTPVDGSGVAFRRSVKCEVQQAVRRTNEVVRLSGSEGQATPYGASPERPRLASGHRDTSRESQMQSRPSRTLRMVRSVAGPGAWEPVNQRSRRSRLRYDAPGVCAAVLASEFLSMGCLPVHGGPDRSPRARARTGRCRMGQTGHGRRRSG